LKRRSLAGGLALLLGVLTLAACNFPLFNPAEPQPGAIYTAAAETAIANATLLAQPRPTITFLVTPQPSLSPAGATAAGPTATGAAPGQATLTPGAAASGCDQADFIEDVTIPDDTRFAPGETFVKTWRLENTGGCAWDSSYAIVFVDGDRLGAPAELALTEVVPPGAQVDLSVELQAPQSSGTYQADFQLRNSQGARFGVGEAGDKNIWVRIRVVDTAGGDGIGFDMVARASGADWFSLSGDSERALAYAGDPDSPDGFAGVVEDVLQEDGRESAKILVTYPPEAGGRVYGEYPQYTVRSGDVFRGRIGFLANSDGSCGPGRAVFRLLVQDEAGARELGEWEKTCNGGLQPVQVSLDALSGDTVTLILEVDSDGPAGGDRALWSSVRIER
jgi:hypothetical protein